MPVTSFLFLASRSMSLSVAYQAYSYRTHGFERFLHPQIKRISAASCDNPVWRSGYHQSLRLLDPVTGKGFVDESALREALDYAIVDKLGHSNLSNAGIVGFHESLQVLQSLHGWIGRDVQIPLKISVTLLRANRGIIDL